MTSPAPYGVAPTEPPDVRSVLAAKPHGPARSTEARLLEWQMHLPSSEDVQRLAEHLRRRHIDVTVEGDALCVSDPWGTCVRIAPQPT
jgi:hypothetical protein